MTSGIDYDKIIVNGDSYSAAGISIPWATTLAEQLNLPLVNIASAGSSNDRITRTTIEQVLQEKNNTNRLIVIVGWSFVRRLEVWYYGNKSTVLNQIPDQTKEIHLNPKFITLDMLAQLNECSLEQKCLINDDLFVHKQITDFYTNVYLLSQFLQNQNVDYLFFSAADNSSVPLNSFPYIESLYQAQAVCLDRRILDLHEVYIQGWAKEHDPDANPITGHLSVNGHRKFANFLLDKWYDIQSH